MIKKQPVLFIGHGSPMLIVEDSPVNRTWQRLGQRLSADFAPSVILVISAHWLSSGSFVASTAMPSQIYDFSGFPRQLYEVEYRPAGAPAIAEKISSRIPLVKMNPNYGLDHGAWCPLKFLFPRADVPVLQFSLDYNLTELEHFNLGRQLAFLRDEDVLIIASGNVVHNLRAADFQPHATPNALGAEFDLRIKNSMQHKISQDIIHYKEWHNIANYSANPPDHYWPLLYAAGLIEAQDNIEVFNEEIQYSSISMTSYLIGG